MRKCPAKRRTFEHVSHTVTLDNAVVLYDELEHGWGARPQDAIMQKTPQQWRLSLFHSSLDHIRPNPTLDFLHTEFPQTSQWRLVLGVTEHGDGHLNTTRLQNLWSAQPFYRYCDGMTVVSGKVAWLAVQFADLADAVKYRMIVSDFAVAA